MFYLTSIHGPIFVLGPEIPMMILTVVCCRRKSGDRQYTHTMFAGVSFYLWRAVGMLWADLLYFPPRARGPLIWMRNVLPLLSQSRGQILRRLDRSWIAGPETVRRNRYALVLDVCPMLASGWTSSSRRGLPLISRAMTSAICIIPLPVLDGSAQGRCVLGLCFG